MLIGVTGNIGAGKSTFCRFVGRYGFDVVDADVIGKSVLNDGKVYKRVLELFGEGIKRDEGVIDTGKLAEIVFSKKEKLEDLVNIVHPEIEQKLSVLKGKYRNSVAFVEAALIVEAGWQSLFDCLVMIFAPRGVRMLRAAKRFGIRETLRRDSMQLPYKEKIKFADYLICNDRSLLNLLEQTDYFVRYLENKEWKSFM